MHRLWEGDTKMMRPQTALKLRKLFGVHLEVFYESPIITKKKMH